MNNTFNFSNQGHKYKGIHFELLHSTQNTVFSCRNKLEDTTAGLIQPKLLKEAY